MGKRDAAHTFRALKLSELQGLLANFAWIRLKSRRHELRKDSKFCRSWDGSYLAHIHIYAFCEDDENRRDILLCYLLCLAELILQAALQKKRVGSLWSCWLAHTVSTQSAAEGVLRTRGGVFFPMALLFHFDMHITFFLAIPGTVCVRFEILIIMCQMLKHG